MGNDKIEEKKAQLDSSTFFLDAQKPEDCFFLVAPVTSAVNTNSWEFTPFSPAFDSKRRDAENFCHFTYSEKIWKVVD